MPRPYSTRGNQWMIPAAIGYRSSPVSVVGSRRALAPLRPRRMAAVALASRALAARALAAAAGRGRRLARRTRWAAHGGRAPRRHARRRARRGVHRRLGRRPRRPVTHPHPSDYAPRRGRGPLARGSDGRGDVGAGAPVRLGRGRVRAGGPAGPGRRCGVRRGCRRRRVRTRRRRRRGQYARGSALPLYRGAQRCVRRCPRNGSGRGHARAGRRARLGAPARRMAVRGPRARRSAGMGPCGVLGGGGRRWHRAAVVAAGDVNAPVLLVSGVRRRRRGAAAAVADASLELAPGVAAALERSGLAGAAERRAAGLPLPLVRRLALAQAVLGHRRVLLLDETLSGMDAGGRRAMCERVRELAASGVAVVLASSDLAAVEQLAARVLVMRDGRVVREAPTAALLRERVLEILLDAPPAAPPPGFRLTPYGLQTDLGPRSAEAALALCREHRLAVRASRVRLRTLEDAVLDAQGDGAR